MTDPQTAADVAAEELGTWLANRTVDDQLGRDLRVVLDDRKRMAAELEHARLDCRRLGDAYASGWHDAIAAVRMPGTHQRKEAWATYRVAREHAWGAETTATRPADGKRTPEQWCAEYRIDIADPDGWRNTGDPAWDEPITLPDFLRRAAVSTTRGLTPDLWNRLSREAHEAADVEKGPESP